MKTTIDDKIVPDRCWYYLLDWNDGDRWTTILYLFDKNRLVDLESNEFWILFELATKVDLLNNSIK